MIVREIKQNPDSVIENFDYFNDYDDTRGYAKENCPIDVVGKLDKGFKEWLMDYQRKIRR